MRSLIAAAIFVVSLLLALAVSFMISRDAVNRLEQQIGRSLALLADEAQDKLDRAMFDRLQALQNLANVGDLEKNANPPAALHGTLEKFQSVYSEFSWVGLVNAAGDVVSATNGNLERTNVAEQNWFRQGLLAPYVGEVRPSAISPNQSPTGTNKRSNYFDLAVPVISSSKQTFGVLAASLSDLWAEEIRDDLLGSLKETVPADVIVLDEKGRVLLGPDDLLGKSLDLPSVRSARAGSASFSTETWPDGVSYLTGFSKSDGYRSYSGLRWIVLVREDQSLAFAPVKRLLSNVVIWGVAFSAFAAFVAWRLAARLALPLLQLSEAAERLRSGRGREIPEVRGYNEVRTLSLSLRSLVTDLGIQRAALAAANQSLEVQVEERTRQLAEQNVGLARAKADAEQATEAKSRFLAAASHDLRQPLHALTLFARALSRRVSGDEAPTLVAQMEEALRGLKGMFDALLNVSRLDAKLIEPAKTVVPLRELIDRITVGAKTEAEQINLNFSSRAKDWVLETDPALLETIIRNLVSNALKFTKQGGVLLAARNRGGRRVIDIYDTGPGLPADRYEAIFDEFSRTDEQASGANDGLGLGLSIARRYAGLLGMKIEVCSRPGHGSRFTVVLPTEGLGDGIAQRPSPQKSKFDVRDWSVLLLDDEPLIVSALSRDLQDRGMVAWGFQQPADAEIALANGLIIDAALIDYDLRSSETGLQFIERISKGYGRDIPTVILSGGTDTATLAALVKSGKPWLTKPADPELIVATLSSVIKSCAFLTSDTQHRPVNVHANSSEH